MASGVGTVGIGATLAGGLLSAYGNQQQGESQQQMYNYRAQVSRINADINRQNAEWTRTKGEREAVQFGQKAAQQFGQIRAVQGASNLDVNTGSQRRVQESQRKLTQDDLAQIRSNAARTAYDYENKARMDENQASLDVMAGSNARTAGNIAAAGSILGTVSSVSDKWMKGKQMGMWG